MANQSDETKLAVISTNVDFIKAEVSEIKRIQQSNFVSKDEFEPIKRLVYGVVGLIMVAVVGAVLSLVITK